MIYPNERQQEIEIKETQHENQIENKQIDQWVSVYCVKKCIHLLEKKR